MSQLINKSFFPIEPCVTVGNICEGTCSIPLISHKFGESAIEDDSSSIFCTGEDEEARFGSTTHTNNVEMTEVVWWSIRNYLRITYGNALMKIIDSCCEQMRCELLGLKLLACFQDLVSVIRSI